jgi:serine protease Do
MATTVKSQLLAGGKVTRSWLGVAIQDMNEELARSFKLNQKSGALITEVSKDSPAERAGLKKGDVIIRFDGKPVNDVADLRNRVALLSPGTAIECVIFRKEKEQTISVKVEEQPAELTSKKGAPDEQIFQKLGMSLQDLTPDLARQLGYAPEQGVLIAGIDPGSPAALARIPVGALIEEVNHAPVHTIQELQQILEKDKGGDDILLLIRHGRQSHFVVLGLK